MNSIIDEIYNTGVVPVVTIERLSDAVPLAAALLAGEISCAEITFRTDIAKDTISEITHAYPSMLVGAGTVLTVKQARDAIDAGAKFIVTPGFNPVVVKYCIDNGITIIPGVVTPTEIETALSFGINTVKFFPAEPFGGANMIKALSAPYKDVLFMPTGGINKKNLVSYLKLPNVVACGGSWMVDKSLIKSGNFPEIERISREAVNTILGFNYELEISEKCGASGNITIKTNSPRRAKPFLSAKGFDFSLNAANCIGINSCGFSIRLENNDKEQ